MGRRTAHLAVTPVAALAGLGLLAPAAFAATAEGERETTAAQPTTATEATTGEESTTAAGTGTARRGEDDQGGDRERRRLGSRTLRTGMRGTDVRRLQKVLVELNFRTRVDGRYRDKTKRAVRRYERWKERVVNGVVHEPQARRMKRLLQDGRRYRTHRFPVRGPHSYGSAGSRFGAPRSGHTHQGQDIAAAEGTRLVAAHEGRVTAREYQAGGAGHYLVVRSRDGSDSVYMHMMRRPRVQPGERVMAGQMIGRVGNTGSSTGPHLHFELWTPHWFDGGSPYDPLPKLRRWDRRT